MATWPTYAKFLADDFAVRRESALRRTDMETGPAKQARVRSRVLVQRSGQVLLESKADYLAFIDWYAEDIAEGAAWFDWTDPVDNTLKTARIVAADLEQTPLAALTIWRVRLTIETWG